MQESRMEEYRIASIRKRLGAFVLDDMITSVLILIIYYRPLESVFFEVQKTNDPLPLFTFFSSITLSFIVLKIIYQTFFIWQNGMTPGKMIMNIRVIGFEDAQKPRFEVAFLRASFRIISEMVFYLGYILAYFNPLAQTLHDKIAKTIVVDA